MSSQNAFPGPNAGRLAARPNTQTSSTQPPWVNPQAQTGRPQQPADNGSGWPGHQQPQQPASGYPSFPQPGFGGQAPEQQPAYGQWSELQPSQAPNRGNYGGFQQHAASGQADPYAPQFEPYVPPSRPNFAPQQPTQAYGNQQQAQWPAQDQHGFDNGGFGQPAFTPQPARQAAHPAQTFGQQQYQENELSAADWAGPHDNFAHDPYQQNRSDAHLGFGQAEGGELEPVYGEEDVEYEDEEEAPRGRRPLMIVAALIGAIVIGGGMAYGYKKITGGGNPQGDPPVIKSAEFPSKTKPADAGGKQFPYSDTKIMGRLGDGTSQASAEGANNSQDSSSGSSDSTANASATDDNNGGARKVSTLVVGRDGTIQSPPPASEPDHGPQQGFSGVPGTSLVDFGQHQGTAAPAPATSGPPVRPTPMNAEAAPAAPTAKKVKPVKVATINSVNTTGSTGSADDTAADAPAAPVKKLKKVARAQPTVETDATADAPPVVQSSTGGGSGFVAVLASIPRSDTSRIDALKTFADMQQKYGSALAGKTPDVASATLAKGAYDRLVVGPPGSREEASNVCSQLKAQGYKDCWVTSY